MSLINVLNRKRRIIYLTMLFELAGILIVIYGIIHIGVWCRIKMYQREFLNLEQNREYDEPEPEPEPGATKDSEHDESDEETKPKPQYRIISEGHKKHMIYMGYWLNGTQLVMWRLCVS